MSALGQSLPKWGVGVTSAFPPLATERRTSQEVRFVPETDMRSGSACDPIECLPKYSGGLAAFVCGHQVWLELEPEMWELGANGDVAGG